MGIRIKVLSSFIILGIILFMASLISITEFGKVQVIVDEFLQDNYSSIESSKKMLQSLDAEEQGMLMLLMGRWDEGRLIIDKADSSFNEAFIYARKNITEEGEAKVVDDLEKSYIEYKKLWLKFIINSTNQDNKEWYLNVILKSQQEVNDNVYKLIEINEKSLYNTASEIKTRAQRAMMPSIIAIISAIIFIIILNYFINIYFISPLIRITKGIQRYNENKIPYNVVIESNDEIGELNQEVQKLM